MKKSLPQIFKVARKKLGLTQQQVAGKAGIDSNTYSRIERGVQKPEFKNIKSIAKVLEIDLNSLPD